MKYMFLVLISLFFLMGCDDNDPLAPGNTLKPYGKWELTDSKYDNSFKYLIIDNDNIVYKLFSDKSGFRRTSSDVAIITGSQIDFGYEIMNYKVQGDVLTLTSPDNYYTFKRNVSAPNGNDWVKKVTPIDTIATLYRVYSDFTIAENNIVYISGYGSANIRKLNLNTGQETSIVTSTSIVAVEWDGAYYWTSNSNQLFKINPVTGNIINTYQVPHGVIFAMAFDGVSLWTMSSGDNVIRKFDGNLNTFTDSLNIGDIMDVSLTFAKGYLYVLHYNIIHKCSISPFRVIDAYEIEDAYDVNGIAYDGNDFWLSIDSYSNYGTLVKMRLD